MLTINAKYHDVHFESDVCTLLAIHGAYVVYAWDPAAGHHELLAPQVKLKREFELQFAPVPVLRPAPELLEGVTA